MKKVGLLIKEAAENQIRNSFKDSAGVFVVKYSGLSSPEMTALRQSLRNTQAELFVVKNSVARHALKKIGLEDIIDVIDGPCGLVFFKDEPVSVSRLLCEFSKQNPSLNLKKGILQDRVLTREDIEILAKLPSRQILRAQVVMTLNAPVVKLVMTLKNSLRKFVYCLEQIKQKKAS
ncbi:MAG: 50S ribosomal protein L10 [Candidatus Omnitrophica bacterium]|nr:50S ribosomal protein L10 [Candidatus Omnitrophota bacterium]